MSPCTPSAGVDITDGASFDITVDGQGYLTSPG